MKMTIKHRWQFALMCNVGFIAIYFMRSNISVALVAMVRNLFEIMTTRLSFPTTTTGKNQGLKNTIIVN